MKNKGITEEYAEKIRPLLPLAQKAYGAKTQTTPAHIASRQYTELLVEFVSNGGSLIDLAQALGASYSGLRRRVFTSSLPSMKNSHGRRQLDQQTIDAAVERVRSAREQGSAKYHAQLAIEYYENGISLSLIAKGLGITNAGPLYYGVQRHAQRVAQGA
jgi:transposase-like protein